MPEEAEVYTGETNIRVVPPLGPGPSHLQSLVGNVSAGGLVDEDWGCGSSLSDGDGSATIPFPLCLDAGHAFEHWKRMNGPWF